MTAKVQQLKEAETAQTTLVDIQAELNAPKNQYNKFGDFNYRSCEDIVEAVKPLLKAANAFLLMRDSVEMVGERYYVKATVSITFPDGVIHENVGYAREAQIKKGMDESQITGSASSYARKYALSGLLALDDNKDSDNFRPDAFTPDEKEKFEALLYAEKPMEFYEFIRSLPVDVYNDLANAGTPKTKYKAKIKSVMDEAESHMMDYATQFNDMFKSDDRPGVQQLMEELATTVHVKKYVWNALTPEVHEWIRG